MGTPPVGGVEVSPCAGSAAEELGSMVKQNKEQYSRAVMRHTGREGKGGEGCGGVGRNSSSCLPQCDVVKPPRY